MANRVTIQDIAKALDLSRNTVSKAINNTGSLSDKTRMKILKKAKEMGYKQFSYISLPDDDEGGGAPAPEISQDTAKKEILVLTGRYIGENHFAARMTDSLQESMAVAGYTTSLRKLLPADLKEGRLPDVDPAHTAGIVCLEIFESDYAYRLKDLGIPLLFVDAPVLLFNGRLGADLLLMENMSSESELVHHMLDKGKTKFGFVGDYHNCQSFYERFSIIREVPNLGIPDPTPYSIYGLRNIDFDNGVFTHEEYVEHQLSNMKELPEVFFCANDANAVELIRGLSKMGLSVPRDIYVAGFDDSPMSEAFNPPLTTVHINGHDMGRSAAQILLSRISHPEAKFGTYYVESEPVYRRSTGD